MGFPPAMPICTEPGEAEAAPDNRCPLYPLAPRDEWVIIAEVRDGKDDRISG